VKIQSEIASILKPVFALLQEKRIKAYLVGGFVRDFLLARPTADIDLAIDFEPAGIGPLLAESLQGKYLCLDELNRISRVVVPVREDSSRSWYVDLSAIAGGDLLADLSRRDFTFNSMAIDLEGFLRSSRKAAVIDPFNGRKALEAKVVEALNSQVFQSDPARLLRSMRFAAELGFSIGVETESWIRRDSGLASDVAGERNREELLRILESARAGGVARYMDRIGLLTALIPELESARGVAQPKEHHWDVLEHSLQAVQAAEAVLHQGAWPFVKASWLEDLPWSVELEKHFGSVVGFSSTHRSLLKLAALLHDVAKPQTKIQLENRTRFFGHDEQGAAATAAILERLRFSRREINLVELMVRHHMRPTQMSNAGRPTPRAIYRYLRDTGEAALDILFLSLADHLAARGPDLELADWEWHLQQTSFVLRDWQARKQTPEPLKRLLDGHDLMREFALPPGPRLREILEAIQEAQAVGEISTRAEALSYVKNRLL
jgi:poly(A) polymerase